MAKGAKTGRDKGKNDDGQSSEKKGTAEASSKRGRSQKKDSDADSSRPNKSGKGDTKGAKPAKGGSKNKSSKPAKGGGKAAKPNVFQRLVAYFRGVRSEMRKVVWPDREEVANSSVIVIATIIFFTLFVLVIDQISSFIIIEQLARLGQ